LPTHGVVEHTIRYRINPLMLLYRRHFLTVSKQGGCVSFCLVYKST